MAMLPYDIWHLITQYLPEEVVKCLYSINKALFEISMNLRYRVAVVGQLGYSKWKPCQNDIKNIGDMRLTHRPSVLKIRLWEVDYICRRLDDAHRGRLSNWNLLRRRRDRRVFPQGLTLDDFLQGARDTIIMLTSLQTVVLEYGICHDLPVVFYHPSFVKFMSEIWNAQGGRITKMDSQLSLEDLAQVIPDVGGCLSRLQHLTVRLEIAFRNSDVDALVATTILPLINNVRHTLTHLDLGVVDYSTDLFAFLRRVEHLTVLESISIPYFVLTIMDRTDYEVLHQFFAIHRQCLKSLTLHFVRAWSDERYVETFFARDWSHSQLPRLVSLDLHLMYRPLSTPIFAYINCFSSSLTSLKLSNYPYFTFDQVTSLLSTLHNFDHLRALHLKVLCFSPELLLLLARQLPRLYSFSSDHRYLCREISADTGNHEPEEWASELVNLNSDDALSSWSLRSLKFDTTSLRVHWAEDTSVKCALMLVLPNVHWFNDLDPQAFMKKSTGITVILH